jgi:exonuclease VII small subunit
VLQKCEERIAMARQKLLVLGNTPNRPAFERLFTQMLGARDQVADAVRRLPMETGELYEEDKQRLEEGVAALDRVFKRWEAQIG